LQAGNKNSKVAKVAGIAAAVYGAATGDLGTLAAGVGGALIANSTENSTSQSLELTYT
jgi:branched-subunit amino acid ABC-type transport system permease component